MPPKIVADTFETLGSTTKSAGQQVVTTAKKMGEDVLEQLGVTKQQNPQADDQKKGPNDEQIKRMEQSSNKRTISRYKELQAQIKAIQERRPKEIPKQISGKPGFSEEKAVKQIEEKPSFAKATAGEGEKLPPLPISVNRSRQKAERHRGVSG